jgi:cytochrome c oxidase subunit 3
MFVLVAAGIAGWWLFVRKLTAKPWEKKQSESDNDDGGATLTFVPAKVGLWLFLAVITSFFGLFISATACACTWATGSRSTCPSSSGSTPAS